MTISRSNIQHDDKEDCCRGKLSYHCVVELRRRTNSFTMNKLLIVLLAVCLVASAHAFVKRDAPAVATPTAAELQAQFEAFQKQLQELGKTVAEKASEATSQAASAFKPDEIKKDINDIIDAVTKALDKLKPEGDAKPAAA